MLTTVMNQLHECRSGSGSEVHEKWLTWWERSADPVLRSVFADEDVVRSLYRTRNEVKRESAFADATLAQRETEVWIARFESLIAELKALKPFIERPGQIIVPDTSAFIEGTYFTDFDWTSLDGLPAGTHLARLVVPILVIEELDGLKRDRRAGDRARSVLHKLWELHSRHPAIPVALPGKPATIEVFPDDPWHIRRPVNDDEIIQRAAVIGEITGRGVVLAAGDYAMLYRADHEGVKAALVPPAGRV